MSPLAGAGGWILATTLLAAVVRLLRRLELSALACHELRGPATALALAVAALAREPGGQRRAQPLEAQLDRLRAGLDDLEAARSGRRALGRAAEIPLDGLLRSAAAGWHPAASAQGRGVTLCSEVGATVVRADRGRLAQALGNLLANAVEHGSGTVELHGARQGGSVVVEVRDEGPQLGAGVRTRGGYPVRRRRLAGGARGRGLGIAAGAVEEAGGRLTIASRGGVTVASLQLPVVDQ